MFVDYLHFLTLPCVIAGPHVDKMERMARSMEVIAGESIKLEKELESALEKVVALEREVMEKDGPISVLRNLVEKPHPVVDFGEKGSAYSSKAFRFLLFSPYPPPPTHTHTHTLFACLCTCFQARL